MTLTPGMLDAMIAAGLSADQIVSVTKAALAADEAAAEAKRAKRRAGNAERQRRFRDRRNADVTPHNAVTERDPPKEYNIQTPSESESEGAREPESDWPVDYRVQVWTAYGQRREQKVSNEALDALKRSGRVPWAEFIAGIRRQAEHVEEKFRPSLQRFIKREKWTDEYAARPNGAQHSFRVVNGSNGHVQASGRSAAQFLRADIERELREAGSEGERIRGLERLPQFGRG